MTRRLLGWLGGCCLTLGMALPLWAQSTESLALKSPSATASILEGVVPEVIAQQRQLLAAKREEIMTAYDRQQGVCWQKFAVNTCLVEARKLRRQALDPLAKQELVLNAQEREWRTRQREIRLEGKQPDGRVSP
jgi:hypothetical protein